MCIEILFTILGTATVRWLINKRHFYPFFQFFNYIAYFLVTLENLLQVLEQTNFSLEVDGDLSRVVVTEPRKTLQNPLQSMQHLAISFHPDLLYETLISIRQSKVRIVGSK